MQELVTTVFVIMLLLTMALPLYQRYQAKARHTEAKTNLGGIHVSELAFYGEHLRYGSFREIGFALRGDSNRYCYRSPANGGGGPSTGTPNVDLLTARTGEVWSDNVLVPSGGAVPGAAMAAGFTATAVSNIDGDPTLDQWHINDLHQGLDLPDVNDAVL